MDTIDAGAGCCAEVRLFLDGDRLRCRACGAAPEPAASGIVAAATDGGGPDVHGYRRRTRDRYRSAEYAAGYLREYRRPRSPSDFYARYVAWRERRAVERCLRPRLDRIASVLDLPAGTGKLAPVHGRLGYRVVAADISVEMMEAGLSLDEWRPCPNVAGFVRGDIMDLRFETDAVDAVVCLRLMHRLPEELVLRGLGEAARVARRYLVVSTRIAGRSLVGAFKRRRPDRARYDLAAWESALGRFGVVEEHRFISPFLSMEVVSVVRVE